MAAPTYATDLIRIVDFDNDSPTMAELTGWTAGRSPTNSDTDYPIQSSTHASLIANSTGKAGMVATGTSRSWVSGDYLFGWVIWLAPGAIATQASGGLVFAAGSSASVNKIWYVGGSDFGSYPYGGWQNFAVDPEIAGDESNGTATSFYVVGGGANVLSAVAKGSPLGIDVFRYGRGELRVAAGDGTTPGTFAGMAAANDATAARWGLFQAIEGGYKHKGLMILGYAAAVVFDDANTSIVIDNTEYVQSDFNAVEIRNASSDVTWENVTMTALGTLSPGTFDVVDNATVLLSGCTFVDMGDFKFLSNSSVLACTFRGCGTVAVNAADMTGSAVSGYEGTVNTGALSWNIATDPDGLLDNMKITKGTAATHAIVFDTLAPLEMTLNGIDFDGYNASNGQNDSTLHIKRTSGTVVINLVGCTGTISYKTNGATVQLVATVPTKITGVPSGAEWRLYEKDATQGIIGSTELDGAESHTGGDITYNDNYSSDTNAALQVLADGYIEYLVYFVLGNAAQTINVTLTPETNE